MVLITKMLDTDWKFVVQTELDTNFNPFNQIIICVWSSYIWAQPPGLLGQNEDEALPTYCDLKQFTNFII